MLKNNKQDSKPPNVVLIAYDDKPPFLSGKLLARADVSVTKTEAEKDLMLTGGGDSEETDTPFPAPTPRPSLEHRKNKRQFTSQNISSVTTAPNY